MAKRRKGAKKPKKINVSLIERPHHAYDVMDRMLAANHPHLADAKIALAWRYEWKADPDGHLILGKCKKASDLDRELHSYDFVILLNSEAWNAAHFTQEQMEALIDHELCHASVAKNEDGEEKVDAHGRPVWRIRKHDVEEFREIVARHGLWKQDLAAFARTAIEASEHPLTAPPTPAVKAEHPREPKAPAAPQDAETEPAEQVQSGAISGEKVQPTNQVEQALATPAKPPVPDHLDIEEGSVVTHIEHDDGKGGKLWVHTAQRGSGQFCYSYRVELGILDHEQSWAGRFPDLASAVAAAVEDCSAWINSHDRGKDNPATARGSSSPCARH